MEKVHREGQAVGRRASWWTGLGTKTVSVGTEEAASVEGCQVHTSRGAVAALVSLSWQKW